MITWQEARGSVEELVPSPNDARPLDNDRLFELINQAGRVGIDAPFGWPVAFVDAVRSWREDISWPETKPKREDLRYRTTDLKLRGKPRLPLSVSSDRLAITTMRCAAILQRFADGGTTIDRSGRTGIAVEIYPAAALHVWDPDPKGYKNEKDGEAKRREIVSRLAESLAEVCPLSTAHQQLCVDSDHVLDALVAALVTRAADRGHTGQPEGEESEVAEVEGWIHVPTKPLTAALV